MARALRSPRFPCAVGGKFYSLLPVHRHLVTPGETMKSLRFAMKVQSLPVKFALMGAYVDVWFFYCPIRGAWPEWESYVLGDGGSLPLATGAQSYLFEHLSGKHKLFGLCYAEVVNNYFREEDVRDIQGDYVFNETTPYSLPVTDFSVEHMARPDADSTDVTVDVSSGSLSVMALRQAQAQQRWLERQDEMSASYANYLASFGVNAAEKIAASPEHLGKYRKFIMPSRSVSEADGSTVQSYFLEMEMNLTKPRFFPEHGYILGVMAVRPKIHHASHGAYDSTLMAFERWPVPGQPSDLRRNSGAWGAITPVAPDEQTMQHRVDYWLKYGQNLTGMVGGPADGGMVYARAAEGAIKWQFPGDISSDVLAEASTLPNNACFNADGLCALHISSPLSLDTYRRRMF